MEQIKSTRYVALDVLRGMTIAGMVLVNNPGTWSHVFSPLRHAAWAGCTPTDLVFPFFLFVVGAAMAFSFAKYNEGLNGKSITKLLKRGVLIFLVGLALNAFPFIKFPLDPNLSFWGNVVEKFSHLRILGVLQRIALCYILGGFLALLLKKPKRIVAAMVILIVLEWVILLLIGDPSAPYADGAKGALALLGQGAGQVDINLFNSWGLIGENHVYHGDGIPFDPEGLVGVISGACTVLLGFIIGNICRKGEDKVAVVSKMFVIGMICLGLGMILSIWLPIIKKLWTGSYVLYAGGWAILMLAFFIYFIDVKKKEKIFTPFKALGMNPLFAFVMAALFAKILGQMITWTTAGGEKFSVLSWYFKKVCCPIFSNPIFGDSPSNEFSSLFFALTYVAVFTLMAWILYKKKIVIKL